MRVSHICNLVGVVDGFTETWLEMYSGYKKKLAENEISRWTQYEVQMPIDWAEMIAKRVPSGE